MRSITGASRVEGNPYHRSARGALAGESTDHYVQRMDEERRRQEAYRKNTPFFPDTRGR
ncbi:MAG: hypothetical protein ACRELB_21185 [Polyangiaceae bacterium]